MLVLAACTSTYAPVVDRYGQAAALEPVTRGSHVVRRGDTLYSIAWRYGRDFRELARANGIDSPYTIYPGQEIRLDRTASQKASSAKPEPAVASTPPASKSSAKKAPQKKPARPASPSSAGDPAWRWPADGPLLTGFSKGVAGRQGITLGGRAGDPVRAAASGTVVYRGSGLTGYGNLLIVKHNERWLSAYAHNREMLVREGQQVQAGDRIATLGDTGTSRTQLHFEVRRDGAPVDPVGVLPQR